MAEKSVSLRRVKRGFSYLTIACCSIALFANLVTIAMIIAKKTDQIKNINNFLESRNLRLLASAFQALIWTHSLIEKKFHQFLENQYVKKILSFICSAIDTIFYTNTSETLINDFASIKFIVTMMTLCMISLVVILTLMECASWLKEIKEEESLVTELDKSNSKSAKEGSTIDLNTCVNTHSGTSTTLHDINKASVSATFAQPDCA